MNTNEIFEMCENTKSLSFWDDTIISSGSTKDFLKIDDQGVVRQFWCTTFPKDNPADSLKLARQLVISIYWENSSKPAISVPLADFFCQQGKLKAFSNTLFNSTNDQLVFNSLIPMPFRESARFAITNNSNEEIHFFFGIDIESKKLSSNILYLNTQYSEHHTKPCTEPIEVCPRYEGSGKYLGTHILLSQNQNEPNWPWYTRPISIFVDQDKEAKKAGYFINTLDDYITSAWWDREGDHHEYCHPHSGRPFVSEKSDGGLECSMYRYHLEMPLLFNSTIHAEIGRNWNFNNQEIGPASWRIVSFLYVSDPMGTE